MENSFRYGLAPIGSNKVESLEEGDRQVIGAGSSMNEIFQALLKQEGFGRMIAEQSRSAIGAQAGLAPALVASGTPTQEVGQGMKTTAQSVPGRMPTGNSLIEARGAEDLDALIRRAMAMEYERQKAAAKPSSFDRIAGYALPAAGMALGMFNPALFGASMTAMGGAAAGGAGGNFLAQLARSQG